jgi:protein-tyrosine phosphatase
MAEALLRREFSRVGIAAGVSSAGLGEDGQPAAFGAVRALRRRGLDLQAHVSRHVTPALVGGASLVVGLERRHVRELVVMAPDAWPRTFTLKEVVRRGLLAGPRQSSETAEQWIERVHSGRKHEELIGDSPHDDVEDPMGAAAADYERTADELDGLLTQLVNLLAGDPATRDAGAATNG